MPHTSKTPEASSFQEELKRASDCAELRKSHLQRTDAGLSWEVSRVCVCLCVCVCGHMFTCSHIFHTHADSRTPRPQTCAYTSSCRHTYSTYTLTHTYTKCAHTHTHTHATSHTCTKSHTPTLTQTHTHSRHTFSHSHAHNLTLLSMHTHTCIVPSHTPSHSPTNSHTCTRTRAHVLPHSGTRVSCLGWSSFPALNLCLQRPPKGHLCQIDQDPLQPPNSSPPHFPTLLPPPTLQGAGRATQLLNCIQSALTLCNLLLPGLFVSFPEKVWFISQKGSSAINLSGYS